MRQEIRTFKSTFEVRDVGDGEKSPVITGYAARFDEDSEPIVRNTPATPIDGNKPL